MAHQNPPIFEFLTRGFLSFLYLARGRLLEAGLGFMRLAARQFDVNQDHHSCQAWFKTSLVVQVLFVVPNGGRGRFRVISVDVCFAAISAVQHWGAKFGYRPGAVGSWFWLTVCFKVLRVIRKLHQRRGAEGSARMNASAEYEPSFVTCLQRSDDVLLQ